MRIAYAAALLATAAFIQPAAAQDFVSPGAFAGDIRADVADADAITARCDEYLAEVEARFTALEAMDGPYTVETTLRAYDDLQNVAYSAGAETYSFSQSMDTPEKRAAGIACYTRLDAVGTRLGLSRAVYDRLAAIDASNADPVTQYYLAETLKGYELSGVNLPEEQRERVRELQEEITRVGNEFNTNYAEANFSLLVLPSELAGLPQDFIDSHPVRPDGLVELTTATPDVSAVAAYAESDTVRERLLRLYNSRAYPENDVLLGQLFTLRQELAELLGFENYAQLVFETRMLDSVEKVEAHMAELDEASLPAAQRDLAVLQEVLDQHRPGTQLSIFNSAYANQLALRERFNLDPQEVRQYFTFDNTRQGIFDLTQDLFQIEIREWDTPVWHPDVEAFQVFDTDGELMGAFYLDSHPRPGKYQHANHIALRKGVDGDQLPVSVLTMNLPRGGYDTGLMEHGQVETFLHEFGHLLHSILGGHTQWMGVSGVANERDFTEAPSQMLEEWVYDYDTLARFARNEAGEVIPRELVERMQAARWFGNGLTERTQLGYSNASLQFHLGAPEDPSAEGISAAYQEYANAYRVLPYPENTHPEATFGHLNGYSAGYYTYGWSRVIAADLFSRFEAEGLRNPQTAMDYRTMVLGMGGSKPAAELIEDFLGRPVNTDAFRRRLEEN